MLVLRLYEYVTPFQNRIRGKAQHSLGPAFSEIHNVKGFKEVTETPVFCLLNKN